MLIFVLLTTLFTANDLKQQCASTLPTDRSFCLGYLTGFEHAVSYTTAVTTAIVDRAVEDYQGIIGCNTEGVTIEQMRLVFLKYVENHPEQLHLPAYYVLSKAMLSAFPCRADKGERR